MTRVRSEASNAKIVVVKFGGTALGNSRRVRRAALRVRHLRRTGVFPVVVVSAQGNTTDRLLEKIQRVSRSRTNAPARREADRALATGEALSASLLAAALIAVGIPAASVSAAEAVLIAEGPHGNADLTDLQPGLVAALIAGGTVPVVAGFQGVRSDGETVTLGRGSSDVTAIFLASRLGAIECHIVTDVDGVYEADPRLVKNCLKFDSLSLDGLVELTSGGARVVHPSAALIARQDELLLRIYHYRAAFSGERGTTVGQSAEAVQC